jgi:predicted GNAT family N-acyltransferase
VNANIAVVDWSRHRKDLLAIRYTVFVGEQGVPIELERDEYDERALHLLVTDPDGQPIGTARMLPEGHVGRMAVLPAWRKQGIGSAMLRELIRIAGENGIDRLFLNAQCEAEAFYRRLGFSSEGGIFVDAGIDHRRMSMQLD